MPSLDRQSFLSLLISHHRVEELHLCYRLPLGRRILYFCARCLGIIPAMIITLVLGRLTGPWPGWLLWVLLLLAPLPALLGGSLLGGLFAVITQSSSLAQVIQVAHSGYVSGTGITMVDELLTQGGLMSMMKTVALIMCALSFGGIMEKTGMLETIAKSLLKRVRTTGSLVATTIFSSIGMNAIASDQYLAIVIPGRMYKGAFDKLGLHPKNLSRCLEDAGTLSSPLIPWNSCGAYMYGVLGVNPLLYLPFAFLNLANPLISIFYGYTGITMTKKDNPEQMESPASTQ